MPAIHVACAAEGSYDAHSAAMLHSVATHAIGADVRVSYLHGPQFPRRSRRRLTAMLERLGGSVVFHEIDSESMRGLPLAAPFGAAMWYRIFLPELLPDVDRVLYLDADTIVTDSLQPLWQLDLDGHYVAATTNVLLPHHRHRPEELGLAGPERYFNSGVLLMNLDEMRRDDCGAALRGYAIEHGARLEWPDQDALNVALGTKRLALAPRWNVMNAMVLGWAGDTFREDELEAALARPAIRHYEGPGANKPWDPRCELPDRSLYLDQRRETPWPRLGASARLRRSIRFARSVLDRQARRVVDRAQ